MNKQLSPKLSRILIQGREEATRLQNLTVGPEHHLLAALKDEQSKAIDLLRQLHVAPDKLKRDLENYILMYHRKQVVELPEFLPLTDEASTIVKMSVEEAQKHYSNAVEVEHLILAILRENNNLASKALNDHNVTYDNYAHTLRLSLEVRNAYGTSDDDAEEANQQERMGVNGVGNSTTRNASSQSNTPMLDSFGVDLVKSAQEGLLDPVIGRESEIERIAQILSRRKKNNPILIGEPGVGKSAIVEGLALRIHERKVPRSLYNKRVIALDMSSVVAGTKYRGQFEERIQQLLAELKKNKDVILFIDEIHTMVGAGSAPGSMDAANMLKPALARGEVQCVGATTIDEFRKTIEKDGALERRFQKVIVAATTDEETLQILHNIKDKYEAHHTVAYSDEAISACVSLSKRYITDRSFPDKAIDVMDEAGSRAHILKVEIPQEQIEQEQRIKALQQAKVEAVKEQNYEQAANLRDSVVEEERKLEAMRSLWMKQQAENPVRIDSTHIEEVVSMMTGVPVAKMADSESIRLKGMKEAITARVIAQDPAIDTVVRAIMRSRLGLKDPNRPIGSFMFLGPTGVGKTHLAKALANFMFGSPDALIRFDMSEYMEKYSVSRLVGAPPGYVGYDEGGQLTERVRRRPYSIILLDEIEKAHNDVFNLLLQVMDEGRLTDSNGDTVDFKNTVIIMTSNTGSRQLKEFGRGIGYGASTSNDSVHATRVIQKALEKQFAPEFLNRIDEIITFTPLDKEAIGQIAKIEIDALVTRVATMGITLHIDQKIIDFVADKGFEPQYGARPLRRAIQSLIEDVLTDAMMHGELSEGCEVNFCIDSSTDKLSIDVSKGNMAVNIEP